ncbi:hypothetical protein JTB14_017201 [Gonioctena quinquepunctata]|nr:hypothetical protein JTB14_017201 [Gonioctena quinquepunctata]
MGIEEKKQSYCTQSQKQYPINLMEEEENGPLLSGKFSQTFTFQDVKNELILSTIAPTSIIGDTNISETPIDFDFTFNDIMEDHPVAEQSVDYVIPTEGNAVVLNDHIYSKEDIIPSSTTASKKKTTFASAISNI